MDTNSQIIYTYFTTLTPQQKTQFEALYNLYVEWNAQINVVSRKDIEHLYLHHVLHSLAIAKFVEFIAGANILDVGTGGGFPGIPLAIMFPQTHFHLVDSIGKKIKVVNEIAQQLELNNVSAAHSRAEQVNDSFDFVLSRAVAPLPVLWQWVHTKIKAKSVHDIPNGLICLKGGDLTEETKSFAKRITIKPISMYFDEAFFEEKMLVYLKK
jgi:16S rRNA (guanine527-N7)-methyltransferase